MEQLKNIQNNFYSALLSNEAAEIFAQEIVSTKKLSAEQRLRIYQQTFIEGLLRALRENYPVCLALVGKEFFDEMAYRYIQQYPSLNPNLNFYGEYFSEFIASFAPAKELIYLADVTHLEWAWWMLVNAANCPAANPDFIQQLEIDHYPHLIFNLAPHYLLTSPYPLVRIIEVNQPDYSGDQTVDLIVGGDQILVFRQGFNVRIVKLNSQEWQILNAIRERKTLMEIIQQNEQQWSFKQWLPTFIKAGWVIGVELDTLKEVV